MSEIVIELKDVHKDFKVYEDRGRMLKERIIFANRNKYELHHVLNGISFSVPKGQAIGFIGKNGCGKSTTLKLLTRILRPNQGTVEVKGRVSSLIELGAGFHPDMSGRENIYINASIFGLKRAEIDERMDDIIRFSELEEFIDNPVRTYSSGMYMRLAFAVAINVNADVLLIDEILAVGDVSFQKKCFEKLKTIKEQGTTIAIVSHSMDQLYSICDRLLWIENGQLREDGIPKQVGAHYLDAMEEERISRLSQESEIRLNRDARGKSLLELTEDVHPEARRGGSGQIRYTEVKVFNANGQPSRIFSKGDKVVFELKYQADIPGESVNFNMDFVKDNWQYCYGSCVTRPGEQLPVAKSEGTIRFSIEQLLLLPGRYYLDFGINGANGEEYDIVRNLFQIIVRDYPNNEFGPCTFEHEWSIE